jgi:putative endonuclease
MRYYYVYIIECADGSYYVGVTNNVEHRFEMHVLGHDINCYTYNRRPLKLVFYELFDDPAIAIAREKQIKGWRREKKEVLIKRDYDLLRKLSRSKT